ncbi:hypothetical protein KJZ67_01180 [Patescibacteria group bacterium]|nr:hypothetical protein [Patescibacteria group bacterium]
MRASRSIRIVFGCIVFIESVVIFYLAVTIVQKNRAALSDQKAVAALHKDQYVLGSNSVFPHFYEPEPDVTLNDSPDWLGYNVSYSINSDTLNERNDYSPEKPEDVYRMVMLGDSFTYGLLVNTYENYTELLEDMLSGVECAPYTGFEVINLGVPAYDVGFSAERYRLRGQKYNPDLVVWFINPFTFEINADRKMELENMFLQDHGKDNLWGPLANGEVAYYPAQFAWRVSMAETSLTDRIALQAKYFDEFLRDYHGSLVIIAHQWDTWSPQTQDVLEERVEGRQHTWIYKNLPDLSKTGGLLKDKHPNANGHRQIAEGVLSFLNNVNALGCEE